MSCALELWTAGALIVGAAAFAVHAEPGQTMPQWTDAELAICAAGGGCRLITNEAIEKDAKRWVELKDEAGKCRAVWRPRWLTS